MPVWFGLHCSSSTFDDPAPERLFDEILVRVRASENLDAGFTGFTFNSRVYPRPDQIAAIGELLRFGA